MVSIATSCANSFGESATAGDSPAAGVAPAASIRGGELIRLADEALARGDLASAKQRYRRVLGFDPRSAPALVGIGRVALAEGDVDAAGAAFERAALAAPDLAEAWAALAEVKARRGDRPGARRDLDRALTLDGANPAIHAQYQALTGRAIRGGAKDLDAALALAEAHPYDPGARLAAGRFLAAAGRFDAAVEQLTSCLWLGDLDPRAAGAAGELLREIDPVWSDRRLVTVVMAADEGVRRAPGWEFTLRNNLLYASTQLSPVLDVWFVPARLRAVTLAGSSRDLESLHRTCVAQLGGARGRNITACFTAIPIFDRRTAGKLGLAGFLGRSLSVRLPFGERHSRVLIHEMLHIYGGIHVADDLDSIMNPSGPSLKLDPLNYAIVRVMANRGFGLGGFDADIVERIDAAAAIDAYLRALRANLRFRKLGALDALQNSGGSRLVARRGVVKARALDPHLADVSRVVAALMIAEDRRIEGLKMLDIAASLYGSSSRDGEITRKQAEELRVALEREYGLRDD